MLPSVRSLRRTPTELRPESESTLLHSGRSRGPEWSGVPEQSSEPKQNASQVAIQAEFVIDLAQLPADFGLDVAPVESLRMPVPPDLEEVNLFALIAVFEPLEEDPDADSGYYDR